jgi:hypothetical protein
MVTPPLPSLFAQGAAFFVSELDESVDEFDFRGR